MTRLTSTTVTSDRPRRQAPRGPTGVKARRVYHAPRAGPETYVLHHHQAAVDGEDLAGDERGLVAGEERDRIGDLRRLAEPPQRRGGPELVLERGGQSARELRVHEARRDGVRGDPPTGELARRRLGQSDEPGLG